MIEFLLAEITPRSASYQTGYWAGGAFMSLLLLAGAIKCGFIAARPTANTKGVLSLMFVLIIFAISGIYGQLTKQMALSPGPVSAVLSGLLACFVLLGLFSSVVLAIWSLVEFRKRKEAFEQGKGQAITALILNGFLVFFAIVGIVTAASARKGSAGAGRASAVIFTNENFRLMRPSGRWVDWNVQKVNPLATFGMMRSGPTVFCSIIAESPGTDLELTTDSYAEIVQANIRSRADAVRTNYERHRTRGGIDGVESETDATVNGYRLHYVHRLIVTNGFAFQLGVWGDEKDQDSVRKEASEIFSSFSLIDRQRIGGVQAKALSHRSATHHYRVSLRAPWIESPNRHRVFPEADFMATHPKGVPFVVVPLDLRGEEVRDETLINALLGSVGFKHPSEAIVGESRTPYDWGTIFRFEAERQAGETMYDYSLVLIRARRYGYLLAAWNDRKATNTTELREAALRSFEPQPVPDMPESVERLTAEQRKAQSQLWNEIGLTHHRDSQFEESARFFGIAGEYVPESGVYLVNQLDALSNRGREQQALDLVTRRLGQVKTSLDLVRARIATLQARTGHTEDALKGFEALFASGYRSETTFDSYIGLLADEERLDKALEQVERYAEKGDSVGIRMTQAALLRRKKEFPKVISLLKDLQQRWPSSAEIKLSLGESYTQSGAYEDAKAVVQELLQGGFDSANVLFLKGRVEAGLKLFSDAKASFEKALEKTPGNAQVRVALAQVSGRLGEGANSEIKKQIEPVPIPKEIMNVSSTEQESASSRSQGAVCLNRVLGQAFHTGKPFKSTEYAVIQIDDRSGVKDFSTLQYSFDPLVEEISVNMLRVKDRAGKIEASGNVSDYYVLDDAGYETVSQHKVLNLPVPNLQPGRIIEVMVTRQKFGSASNYPYSTYCFAGASPARSSSLVIMGEVDKLHVRKSAESIRTVHVDGGTGWTVSNPATLRWEPLQPPLWEFAPVIRVTDARSTWESEVADYDRMIHDRFEISPTVKRTASNLVAEAKTPKARIEALSSFVQTNISYRPIEFGWRAVVPQKAEDTLRNRYGDCKDHALLLMQLAESAGVPARLALVSAHRKIDRDSPALDQFDHMIVFLPESQPAMFLDCTDKGSHLASGAPPGLAGKDALILEGKGYRFMTIPASDFNTSRIRSERRIVVTNSADFAVSEKLTLRGPIASVFRSWLRETQPSARIRGLQYQLSDEAEVSSLEVDNLERTDQALDLQVFYKLRGQFRKVEDQLVGQLPCVFEKSYFGLSGMTRTTPAELTIPVTFESDVRFMMPPDYSAQPMNTRAGATTNRFSNFDVHVESDRAQIGITWKAERKIGSFSPSEYDQLRASLTQALEGLGRTVVLKSTKPL
jgi:tetratricopeptide (TPR) repeat protein